MKWMKPCLATAAATGAACLLRSQYERTSLEVGYYRLTSEKIKTDRTLVFLSDLHDNEFGRDNCRLLEAIGREKPDAVLIGGDMMVCKGKPGTDIPLSLIRRLRERYPVYCGNGNHENRMKAQPQVYGSQYEDYVRALREMGVVYLEDEGADLGDDIKIWGIDLEETYYSKFRRRPMPVSYLKQRLGAGDPGKYQILLIHSPLYAETCSQWGADLSLAGHFHGGTIRLPFLGGVMTPQFQFFLPWCKGLFETGDRRMIVSPGLGTHSINIRLNNKPQLVVVKLKNKTIF